MKYNLSGFQNFNRKALDDVGRAIEELDKLRRKVVEAEAAVEQMIEDNGLQALFGAPSTPAPAARTRRPSTGEGAKAIVVPDEYKAGLVEFLATQKEPLNVDAIAREWVGEDGKPNYSKATISQRMPVISKEGLVKITARGTSKFYSAA
jgi:hypothetical protein